MTVTEVSPKVEGNEEILRLDPSPSKQRTDSRNDIEDILQLYKDGLGSSWFDPKMLETKQYFGIRMKNRHQKNQRFLVIFLSSALMLFLQADKLLIDPLTPQILKDFQIKFRN